MASTLKYGYQFTRGFRRLSNHNALKPYSTSSAPQSSENSTFVAAETFENVLVEHEELRDYKRGSRDLFRLETVLDAMQNNIEDIPIFIDGQKQSSRIPVFQFIPCRKNQRLARFHYCTDKQLFKAIDCVKSAQKKWDQEPIINRIAIWEKAANILANKYRAELVASTMLGQAQCLYEAEQDAAVDVIDSLRLNANYLKLLAQWQPSTSKHVKNRNNLMLRGMEGFVAAICPFNSTALAANLALTPALMGNCVLWKPHNTNVMSCWIIYKAMLEAGLPPNVISFVPTDCTLFSQTVTHSEHLTAINYAGCTLNFKMLWKFVAKYLEYYHQFPRLIGECGGKNFHFVHESADPNLTVDSTICAAFEYSGQKRSSCTRLFVPQTLWESDIKNILIEKTNNLQIGDVKDYNNFTSAVIDLEAFSRLTKLIETVQQHPKFRVIAGGKFNGANGYYIYPTILQCSDMYDRIYRDDYVGPVLIVYVYKEKEIKRVMDNLANNQPYAMTGSIFAQDENFIKTASEHFRSSVGNLFFNDKCTSIRMSSQPFGGTRMCGTNGKIGSPYYLLHWTNMQIVGKSCAVMSPPQLDKK